MKRFVLCLCALALFAAVPVGARAEERETGGFALNWVADKGFGLTIYYNTLSLGILGFGKTLNGNDAPPGTRLSGTMVEVGAHASIGHMVGDRRARLRFLFSALAGVVGVSLPDREDPRFAYGAKAGLAFDLFGNTGGGRPTVFIAPQIIFSSAIPDGHESIMSIGVGGTF